MLACLVRGYTLGILVISVGFLALGGCSPDQEKPNVRSVEGVVGEINADGGTVTVRVYSSKYKKEVERTVYINDETEILINGALATLSDVKIGEKAVGSIRIERDGEDKRYVALRVQIERAEVLVAPATKKAPVEEKAPDESATKGTTASTVDTPANDERAADADSDE